MRQLAQDTQPTPDSTPETTSHSTQTSSSAQTSTLQATSQSTLGESLYIMKSRAMSHVHAWSFLVGVCVCGLVFGGAVAGQLNPNDISVLSNSVQSLLIAIKHGQLAAPSDLWWQRLTGDLQVLALLWLFGVSVIGLPFVVIALFLRSFSVGFAVGFTVIHFGWKGFLLALSGIFLHQFVSMTVLVVAGALAIRFSARILQQAYPLSKLSIQFLQYTGLFALCSGGLMLSAAIQAYAMPHLLSLLLT